MKTSLLPQGIKDAVVQSYPKSENQKVTFTSTTRDRCKNAFVDLLICRNIYCISKRRGIVISKNTIIKIIVDDNLQKVSLKPVEVNFIKNMTVTGAATQTFLAESLGEKRIRKLCKLGIFEKIDKPHRIEIDGKIENRHWYELGEIGKKFALEQNYCQVIQGKNGYKHTEKMERVVDELLVKKNIDICNIYNEKEQKIIFKKELRELRQEKIKYHINDIAYKDNENRLHSIEIVTDNYGKKTLEKHQNFADKIGAIYSTIGGEKK